MIISGDYDDEAVLLDRLFRDVVPLILTEAKTSLDVVFLK